jgi:hypothetical protein
MSIQLTGAGRRFRVSAALVALALAVAVFVLATQARSIWSTRNDPQVQPRQAIVVPATNMGLVSSGHIRPGCRPKFGCQNEGRTGEGGSGHQHGLGEQRPHPARLSAQVRMPERGRHRREAVALLDGDRSIEVNLSRSRIGACGSWSSTTRPLGLGDSAHT